MSIINNPQTLLLPGEPLQSTIALVVVLYHPDDTVIDNINSYKSKVKRIYVIDNTPQADKNDGVYDQLAENIEYISNGLNLGIATALNIAVKQAIADGYTWVATFDQDSWAPDDLFDRFRMAWHEYHDKDKIAIITPSYVDASTGHVYSYSDKHLSSGIYYRECFTTITSGNLLNTRAFLAVGGFDDKLFIDYVDHEFCLRCNLNGYKIIEAVDAKLLHSIGQVETITINNRLRYISNHTPIRKCYFIRNVMHVYTKYFLNFPKWILKDAKAQAKNTILEIIFSKERTKLLKSILVGFYHFLTRHYGTL